MQVPERAISQPSVWYLTQLFLYRLDEAGNSKHIRLARFIIDIQHHRVQAGEPADSTGKINARRNGLFPAMAFQADHYLFAATPLTDGLSQSGQQQVVDLGVVGQMGACE